MPSSVLYSLLKGAAIPAHRDFVLGVCNLSPYDGCLEHVCSKWHVQESLPDAPHCRIVSLSIGFEPEPLSFSERVLGMTMLQARTHVRVIILHNKR